MNSYPLVSIVIPVYNGNNYLREAIDSALAQTYRNCEIIVVNDGSTDNTEEICLSYGDRIRYFSKENAGVATAVNLGIKNMRGEYFSWLSHDDICYPNKIQYQLETLRKLREYESIVIGNFDFLDMNIGQKVLFDLETLCNSSQLTDSVYPALFGIIHACVMLVHKSHIDRVGNLDENLRTTQDIDWIFRLLRGQKTVFIKQSLIAVRLHREQGKHHIKEYNAEQATTHISFMKRITLNEIIDLFGSEYSFYFQMASFYKRDNNTGAFYYAKRKFEHLTPPSELEESITLLRERLLELSSHKANKLCIFGAGKIGQCLCYELLSREIKVDFFLDNNPALWDTKIYGISCISPRKADKNNALIIVTTHRSNDLSEKLLSEGFSYIVTYFDIINIVTASLPKHIIS
jgi:glycosyltransferase involved in cell wall biosynthesis